MAFIDADDKRPNRGIQKGQMAWRPIIESGRLAAEPKLCSICNDALEKIATAPLKGGAVRYACMWCQQRYNVIESWKADIPDQAHPDFGAF